MNITVIGSGRWASFLAWYAGTLHADTLMWGRDGSKSYTSLAQTRRNDYVVLPQNVRFTTDIADALDFGDIVLVAIQAQQLRAFCKSLTVKPTKPMVLCMKGLEQDTGLRLTQVVREELGDGFPLAVWVGPGHPQDFVRGIPNCMVIDADDPSLIRRLVDALSGPLIRLYYGEDLIGTEIGAASKNVVGIAAGMLDGLGMSSLKGVLMARGAREVSRLAAAMGGKEITVYGLCHLGDYEATLFSPHSHNRRYGECMVHGESFGELAEGAATAHSMVHLSEEHGVELPICRAVVSVLTGCRKPQAALAELFDRSVNSEFYMV